MSDSTSDTDSTVKTNSPTLEDDLDAKTLEECEALLICLSTGRFVIARPGQPKRNLWPIGGGWDKVRMLRAGDQVVYKGTTATVRAIEVYR